MKALVKILTVFCFLALATCDVYMHSPRGSNNRLNENTATRTNGNRLFDSQNNARGGYNVGDVSNAKSNSESQQYRMSYFQSGKTGKTELTVEWTNQHGCGGNEDNSPHKLNCNLVLQFMCQENNANAAPDDSLTYRNGQQRTTQTYTKANNDNDNENTVESRRNNNVQAGRGLHESWEWYDSCYRRERNKGLFTADQQLNNNNLGVSSAIFTRQSPNDNRQGYECPEERDYYPYFHPTPWVDIAVLAHNESSCSNYEANSFNQRTYGECVETFSGTTKRKHWSTVNNPTACAEKDNAEWVEYHSYLELASDYKTEQDCLQQNNNQDKGPVVFKWGKPYDVKKIVNHDVIEDACFIAPPALDCKEADWSRVNHLGNGRDLTPLNYTWTLPYFPSGETQRCVLRLRENNVVVKRSPIEQNPLVDIGANGQLLQLAINTDQTGRTFQDRSHVFLLEPRKDKVPDSSRIINLNVRGKRGNIVQVYPAVEYDFIPNRLEITEQDLVHIQWTGSNSHDNNAPGGDGQTGDAGEGTGGTDRSNIVEIIHPGQNYPTIYENSTLFKNMEVVYSSLVSDMTGYTTEEKQKAAAIQLLSSGYFSCEASSKCGQQSVENKNALNNLLNNAPASFMGLVVRVKKGVYYYMCSRNSNFTNRSQKGQITVK